MVIPRTADVFEQHEMVHSWDREYYHPIAEYFYDRAIETMLRHMGAREGDLVLDAGCGPGVHSIRVARSGCRVCAVDISQTMLQHAVERITAAGLASKVATKREDLTQLSFPDGEFRYVFSWGVLLHIPAAGTAIDELARITSSGGSLALYLTNYNALDQKIEALARLVLRKRLAIELHPLGPGTWYDMHGGKLWVRQFNIPEVIRRVEARGFSLARRLAGELSQLQARAPVIVRPALLHLNNLWFRLSLPAGPAAGNLLVFRKRR